MGQEATWPGATGGEPRAVKALIVGAGIGGLTAAIALRRAGCAVELFERAAELRPAGAGLTLAPNAGLVLRTLGLLRSVEARGAVLTAGELRAPSGRLLQRAPIGEVSRELGVPMLALHRAALQEALLAALREARGAELVRLGRECLGFEERDDGVVVRLAGGEEVGGDLLVGADGLHSAVRRQLHGEEPLRYSGYTSWRGVVAADTHAQALEGRSVEVWGRGRRFGMVPLGEGSIYWFATLNAPRGGDVRDRDALLGLFGSWFEPIPALIAATDPAQLIQTDIVDRPPLATWGRGRVTLLGDAAHPSTPNLGQGAGQAIEDALVLADSLRRGGNVPLALRDYERRRRPRTAAMTELAWRFGRLAQLESPLLVRPRDAFLPLTPDRIGLRQFRRVVEPDAPLAEALGR